MMEKSGEQQAVDQPWTCPGISAELSHLALTCIHPFFFFFISVHLVSPPVNQFNITYYYYYDLIILAVIDQKKWEMMLMDRFIQMGFSPILYGKTLQTVMILTIRTSTETLPV